jgi:hypothetical protein
MGMMIRKSKHQVVTLKRQRIHDPRILCEPEMAHITMICGSTSDTSARKHFETTEHQS